MPICSQGTVADATPAPPACTRLSCAAPRSLHDLLLHFFIVNSLLALPDKSTAAMVRIANACPTRLADAASALRWGHSIMRRSEKGGPWLPLRGLQRWRPTCGALGRIRVRRTSESTPEDATSVLWLARWGGALHARAPALRQPPCPPLQASQYIEQHGLQAAIEKVINSCVHAKPEEPFAFMVGAGRAQVRLRAQVRSRADHGTRSSQCWSTAGSASLPACGRAPATSWHMCGGAGRFPAPDGSGGPRWAPQQRRQHLTRPRPVAAPLPPATGQGNP